MVSNRLGLALIGGAMVVAAGAGGFVASHRVTQPPPAAVAAPQPSQPVQETESAVTKPSDEPAASAQSAVPAPEPTGEETPVTTPPAAKPSRSRPAAEPRPAHKPSARTQAPVAAATPTPTPAPPAAPRAETPVATSRPTASVDAGMQRPDIEPVPPPPERHETELVVDAESVIGLQLESTVSSETARIEDPIDARVTRDVMVDGKVAIPAGSRARGAVTFVDRGGKMRERARLGVRFHTLTLADGTSLRVQTDTIYREGESPSNASAAKIGGGAIGGAILGAILGGARGAVIGGTTGAAGGTAAVMAGQRRPATLTSGSTVTVRVLSPVHVTVDE